MVKMQEEELGVQWYCFGEYSCGLCGRKWESSKAWKNYGQKCKSCNIDVKAHSIQPLVHYCCVPCMRVWKSKRVENGVVCQECNEIKLPFKSHKEFKAFWLPLNLDQEGKGNIDPNKRHQWEFCQKCIALGPGMLCYNHPALNPTLKNTKSAQINGRNVNLQATENRNPKTQTQQECPIPKGKAQQVGVSPSTAIPAWNNIPSTDIKRVAGTTSSSLPRCAPPPSNYQQGHFESKVTPVASNSDFPPLSTSDSVAHKPANRPKKATQASKKKQSECSELENKILRNLFDHNLRQESESESDSQEQNVHDANSRYHESLRSYENMRATVKPIRTRTIATAGTPTRNLRTTSSYPNRNGHTNTDSQRSSARNVHTPTPETPTNTNENGNGAAEMFVMGVCTVGMIALFGIKKLFGY